MPHKSGYLRESTWDFLDTKTSVKVVLDGVAILMRARLDGRLLPELSTIISRSLKEELEISYFSVFEFRRGMQPQLLYREDSSEAYDSELTKYLNGMYLLDPFYNFYVNDRKTGTFHFCAETLEELGSAPYFERYWRLLGHNHEVGGLYEIAPDRCIHVSFQFTAETDQAAARAVEFTTAAHDFFTELFRETFAEDTSENENDRRDVHAAVGEALRDFGADNLTEREQEIARLMLKGHSAKMIARILDISPGTASIHRSNIYRKMDVTSVGDLFGQFLTRLTSPAS